jgi:hypothetical protein
MRSVWNRDQQSRSLVRDSMRGFRADRAPVEL